MSDAIDPEPLPDWVEKEPKPNEIDVRIFVDDSLPTHTAINDEATAFEAADVASWYIESALRQLERSWDLDGVTVDIYRDSFVSLDLPDDPSTRDELFAFRDWLREHPEHRAADSNLYLSSMYGGGIAFAPRCHLTNSCETRFEADAAVCRVAYTLPYMHKYGKNTSKVPMDVDADGLYEDVDMDGQFTFDDVVELSFEVGTGSVNGFDVDSFDFAEDGEFDFGDVEALAGSPNMGKKPSKPVRMLYKASLFTFPAHAAVHEVGHNIGLHHDMGEGWTDAGNNVASSVMLSNYIYEDSFQGTHNRFGNQRPTLDNEEQDVRYFYEFSDGIKANKDLFYDEP